MEAQGFGFTRCVQPTKRTLTIAALGLPLAALPIWFGAWLWIAWGLAWAVLLLCLAYDLVTQLGTGDFEVEVAAPASCGIATGLELEIAISRRTRSRRTLVDIHLDLSGPSRPLPVRSCSLATPGSTRISITLPYSTYQNLIEKSDHEGRSMSNLAAFLLESALREENP